MQRTVPRSERHAGTGLSRCLTSLGAGVIASWAALSLSVVGSVVVASAPGELLHMLRVYASIVYGAEALTSNVQAPAAFATAIFLYTVAGAVIGAPIYAIYRRRYGWHTIPWRLMNSLWLGMVMWLVNYYAILSWAQPLALRVLQYEGERRAYIPENVPGWVAAATHVTFVAVLLILQEPTEPARDDPRGDSLSTT